MNESKKEALARFHRDNIIRSAEQLFIEKGIEGTTMDDIARASQYSKATLYVYFKNKEEIISSITLISMKMFRDLLQKAICDNTDYVRIYYDLCYALVDFQKDHPLYFDSLLKEINVELDSPDAPPIYREIYDAGEEINQEINTLFHKGIEQGIVKEDVKLPQASFIFWASICGIIRMARQKEKYFTRYLGINQKDFLQYSFEMLFQSIAK